MISMIDRNTLIMQHEEELHDAEKYKMMANDCPEWRSVLNDIAHDEEQHAHMIEHIIEHM